MHWVKRMLQGTGSWQSSALQESRDGPFEYFWEAEGRAAQFLSDWFLSVSVILGSRPGSVSLIAAATVRRN